MKRISPSPLHTVTLFVLLVTLLAAAVNLHALLGNSQPPSAAAQGVHDVAIGMVSVSQNSVIRGEPVYINVTAQNQGDFTETFNVTAFAGTRPISMPQTINNLPAGASQNLIFTWDTATASEGYHQIKAVASVVQGETDLSDNTYIDGNVSVSFTANIGSSEFYISTNLPFQRKTFHAAGLHWVFYSDYSNMVYKTSTDGITWTSPAVVREALYGYLFSVWFDGTRVHYAYRDIAGILYRRGSINGATITWEPEHMVMTGNLWVPNICVDTSGFPWISYRTNNLGTPAATKPYIVKATAPDGSSWGTPKQLSALDQLWWVVPVPLTSGKVYVLYSYPKGPIYGNLWNGDSWLTAPETATPEGSATRSFGTFSSAAKGDNIYVVYVHNFTSDIVAINRSSSGWSSEVVIAPYDPDVIIYPEPPDPAPTITVDPQKGDLYVRWVRQEVYQVKYDSTLKQWDTPGTPFGTIFNSPDPRSLTSYYRVWDSLIGSAWDEGTMTPYTVMYISQQV